MHRQCLIYVHVKYSQVTAIEKTDSVDGIVSLEKYICWFPTEDDRLCT